MILPLEVLLILLFSVDSCFTNQEDGNQYLQKLPGLLSALLPRIFCSLSVFRTLFFSFRTLLFQRLFSLSSALYLHRPISYSISVNKSSQWLFCPPDVCHFLIFCILPLLLEIQVLSALLWKGFQKISELDLIFDLLFYW